jgi:hypothetical protein
LAYCGRFAEADDHEGCISDDLTPRKNIFGKALVGIAPQLEVKLVRIVMKEGGASWDEDAWLVSNILACTLLLQT